MLIELIKVVWKSDHLLLLWQANSLGWTPKAHFLSEQALLSDANEHYLPPASVPISFPPSILPLTTVACLVVLSDCLQRNRSACTAL